MSNKIKIFLLLLILISLPLTIILVKRVQNYRNFAAEPVRKMALGISLPYGFASRDIQTDAQIAEIEKFASPVASGGVGAYPASYSIWTNFDEGGWQYGQRNKFPSQKILNYLDSKKITPMIFMAPVGNMRKSSSTLAQAQKYSNQSIASGAWDSYLIEWAQSAKAYGKPVVLRYAWEMNGTWFPWSPYTNSIGNSGYYDVGNTPENYVAAWRHIYSVIKPIAPNVKFYWCPNAVTSAPNTRMASFYPGNNYVDYVGFDAYNWYPKQPENNTLSNIYATTIQALRHVQTGSTTTLSPKPIIVGETGLLVNNELRAEKFNYGTIYNTYPDLKSIVYFDIDPSYLFGVQEEPGNAWRLSGKSDHPQMTTQGVDLRPKYNTFVVQDRFMGNLNSAYEQSTTNSPTPQPATSTPSPLPVSNQPSGSPTPGIITFKFTGVKIHGIGNGGDNANPNATGNSNPSTKIRNFIIEIYDGNNKLVTQAQGNLTYSPTLGYFTGDIPISTNIPNDFYLVKIRSDRTIKKQASGIPFLSKGSTITIPLTSLTTGNSNNDDSLGISDYNIIIDCYSDFLAAKNCSDLTKKLGADLNDDGKVNQADYNLFLRESSNLSGN